MTIKNQVNRTLLTELRRTFVQMISDLDDPKQIDAFFRDFFTESEYDRFTKRMAIVYWIKKDRDEKNIKENLKATNSELMYAKELMKLKGIKLAIKHLEAEEWANMWIEKFRKLKPGKI